VGTWRGEVAEVITRKTDIIRKGHDLEKVLSIVMDHEEIQQIADAARRVLDKRSLRIVAEEADNE
jgi:hypothetical protein